ncbi:hypothetical protein [Streptomyces liangshanensis]|uniref:hypothetical protein n=1 Tax=Streptomyces liangshanensis TaxID=2717324 RepID=UPI0036DD7328
MARAVGVDRFVLRHVFLNAPEPSWLGEMHDGRVVDLAAGLRLLRENLRHGTNPALLESGDGPRWAARRRLSWSGGRTGTTAIGGISWRTATSCPWPVR